MLYDNPLWIEDIDTVSKGIQEELNTLAGKAILITGASGLICSAIVDVLFRYNDTHEKKIMILAAGRSKERMRKRFSIMADRDDFLFVYFDSVSLENKIDQYANYIIHGAGNAYPSRIVKEPVETMLGNIIGTNYLLHYAKEQKTKRFLYISSSEIYGKKNDNEPYKENDYGYINLLNPRNSYSIGKRAAETLCVSYAAEYCVDSVIVRPGHIYGPTASPSDNRVSSAWAYAAARKENIVIKSDGAQLRSYVYCLDCAAAILKALLRGKSGSAYNISNPDSVISIREMGELLTKAGNVRLIQEVPTDSEKKGFNPMFNSSLDGTSLISLGLQHSFSAVVGIDHTIKLLKKMLDN